MSSSSHIDNKGKDILILGKGPTQGLGEQSLSAEKMYSINFTKVNKKFINLEQKILRLFQIIFAEEIFQKISQQVT